MKSQVLRRRYGHAKAGEVARVGDYAIVKDPTRVRTYWIENDALMKYQSAIVYDDGSISYDFPERLPAKVKAKLRAVVCARRKEGLAA